MTHKARKHNRPIGNGDKFPSVGCACLRFRFHFSLAARKLLEECVQDHQQQRSFSRDFHGLRLYVCVCVSVSESGCKRVRASLLRARPESDRLHASLPGTCAESCLLCAEIVSIIFLC